MSTSATEPGRCVEQTIHVELDQDTISLEDVPNDAASRAIARRKLTDQIISRASNRWLQTYPWFTHVDIRNVAALLHAEGPDPTQPMYSLIKYNSLAPIHILPPEVLASAFFHLAQDPKISATKVHECLVRASTVCVFWRHTIISSPRLWSRIDLASEHADVALKLSKTTPIRLEYSGIDLANVSTPLFDHVTHVESLRLTMPLSAHGPLLGNFPSLFPLLHTLVLENMMLWDDRTSLHNYPLLDSSIAHSSMPSLRTLKLRSLWLPLSLPLFRGLVDLHLEFKNGPMAFALSTFRDALTACPNLESLRLHSARPIPSETIYSTPIPLPRLRKLDLKYADAFAAASTSLILNNIQFPATATLKIRHSIQRFSLQNLKFYSAGTSTGKLYVAGGGDPQLLRYLPRCHTLIYSSRSQTSATIEGDFLAVLATLELRHLRALKIEGMLLCRVLRVLSGRYSGALRKLILDDVPWGGLREREEELEAVKELATFVKVAFRRKRFSLNPPIRRGEGEHASTSFPTFHPSLLYG
ncbi:hypothetical protein DENSPDRAFT_870125 [Dentipellis sp. KUC8613]|nr:hypothetical protein DENSPDRAFT_870125 [Dentipellis sp. KUC8613]